MNKINKINIKGVDYEIEATFNYASYGLPVLYVNGDISTMTKDDKVTLNYVYGDLSGTCTMKWQGSSSLAYPKKNYTITFDNKFEAKDGWGEQKKYCLKANYIDFSHARNLVSAKLWGQIAKSRKVKTKNLLTYPYVNTTFTRNGVTFTDNGDGSISVKGTATTTELFVLSSLDLEGSPIYQNNGTNGSIVLSGGSENVRTNYDSGDVILIVVEGTTVDETIYPQCELGTTATEYVRPSGLAWDKLENLINGGAVDGFPISLVINDEYQGIYTFNIPKDSWMFGMGDGENEAIVCADAWGNGTSFKAEATIDKIDNIEYADFSLEYAPDEDNAEWVKTSLNRLINACINSDGTDLDTTIAQYLDWGSAIDYLIFSSVINGIDMIGKNYILATFDGVKWFFSAYDMDSTYGLSWDGGSFYHLSKASGVSISQTAVMHKVMELIKTYKLDELKARYNELRNGGYNNIGEWVDGVLSEENVNTLFANFIGQIPKAMLDEEVKIWKGLPSTSVNNLSQIVDAYKRKCAIIDEEVNNL